MKHYALRMRKEILTYGPQLFHLVDMLKLQVIRVVLTKIVFLLVCAVSARDTLSCKFNDKLVVKGAVNYYESVTMPEAIST